MEEKANIEITSKAEAQKYLLLSFYLQKLTSQELGFLPKEKLKEFAHKLSKFSQNLQSFK